jgi:TPR repeat protein
LTPPSGVTAPASSTAGFVEVERPSFYFGEDRPERLRLHLTPPPLLYRAFGGDLDALSFGTRASPGTVAAMRRAAWWLVVSLVTVGCSDPEPAPLPEPHPSPEPSPQAEEPSPQPGPQASPEAEIAETEGEIAEDPRPLAELSTVPVSAPQWIAGTAAMCRDGDPHGCWLLGAMHLRGLLGAVDRARARDLFARACAADGGYGCAELAGLLEGDAARAPLVRGCDANRADACAALAEHLEPTNTEAATTARMRACSLGRGLVCVPVPAALPHDATPAPAGEPTEASRVPSGADPTVLGAAQRCDQGMAAMCAWLGLQYSYDNDFGLPPNPGHALDLVIRSCNETALAGCTQLGMMLLTDAQSREDAQRAGEALRRACSAGIAEACAANASVVSHIPRMEPMARLMRFEACVLGDEESCESP